MSIMPAIIAASIASRRRPSYPTAPSQQETGPALIIEGSLGSYICWWETYGHSYAQPVVATPRRVLGIRGWRRVWEGEHKTLDQAKKMYPETMRAWFTDAVEAYEQHQGAWREWSEKEASHADPA